MPPASKKRAPRGSGGATAKQKAKTTPKKAVGATTKSAAAKKGAGKQQTILDSLKKSALRRKGKADTKEKENDEDSNRDGKEEGREAEPSDGSDVEMEEADEAPMPVPRTRTLRRVIAKAKRLEINDAFSDSEEESKGEEKARHRQTRVLSSQRKSLGGEATLDEVLTGSYLLSSGNSSELSRRLKQTWHALQDAPNQQDDAEVPLEKLRLLCTELLHDKIMENAEKNVRSLAACCFVEIMRVFAPDMPFKSNEELYDAFQLILEQIRSLAIEGHDERTGNKAASSTDLHNMYVLESLANVKSCLLLVGMEYTPDDSEEPTLVQLFRTLFNTIRKEHSVKIENLMLSIMVACIEESEAIDQPLLDAILVPLVHSNPHVEASMPGGNDKAAGDSSDRGPYHMAQELIHRTSEQLQSHLSHFFNSVLVDASSSLVQKASELKEHVYTLIYEVHKINPSLLLYVLPNVCMQLQVDEVATRSEAIALMGRLFASTHADYGHDYMKNFRDFLGRFRDVSKEIRLQMVQVSAIIWQRKPELAASIEKEFIGRLTDPEWEVRRLVVNEVCDLAANNLEAVSEECLRQVGERVKDKRVILRKETMTGLSQVYATHVSSFWAPEDEGNEDEFDLTLTNVVPGVNVKKLGWVPDYVLKCFAYPQEELKLRVIQLLDDILLPKAFSEAARAKCLLFIYHALDHVSREALRRIFVERSKCVSAVDAFLKARKLSRKASASPTNVETILEKARETLLSAIKPVFSETDNLSKLIDQLIKWKDQSVFKQLEIMCECSKSQEEYRAARDRLVKSVGSKSSLGEFLKNFCRKLNLLTVSEATVGTYMSFFANSGLQPHRENRPIAELLLVVAKTTPTVFSRFVREDFDKIFNSLEDTPVEDDEEADEKDMKVVNHLLNVLAHFSDYWKQQRAESLDELDLDASDTMPSDTTKNFLKECCLGASNALASDDGSMAKFAAQSLANFFGEAKDVGALVSKLCSKKYLAATDSAISFAALNSLHEFAKRSPMLVVSHDSNVPSVWHTLFDSYLQSKQDGGTEQGKSKKGKSALTASKLADLRSVSVKVLTDLLLYCHDCDSGNLLERSRQLMQLLFDVLRSDGRMWTTSGSLPAKYRVAAACNLLKLMRHRTIEHSLSVSEWHILGFVMQDSTEDVRKAFMKTLTTNLMKRTIPHPHKYVSYLVLAATETNVSMRKNALGLLGASVERMRRVFEASSVLQSQTDEDAGNDERQNANALLVPEYALPYVIHLLAHHPDYPVRSGKDDRPRLSTSLANDPVWSEQVTYLTFFLDGLMPHNVDADNIAFLLQVLTKLSEYHDSSDPSSNAIYPLIECAVSLLKRRIKVQSNLKAFPGKIFVPKMLYSLGKSTGAQSVDPTGGSATRQPRISASLSPIKPSVGSGSMFVEMKSPPPSSQKRRPSPGSSSVSKAKRKPLPKSPTGIRTSVSSSVGEPGATPSRRQSLMRMARAQAKTFVDDSSESGDDSDSFIPRASVASRFNKRVSATSSVGVSNTKTSTAIVHEDEEMEPDAPQFSTPSKRRRMSSAIDNEETKGEAVEEDDDDEQMSSFRSTRRRKRT